MKQSLIELIRAAEAQHGRPLPPLPWQAELGPGSHAVVLLDDANRFGYLALREPPEPIDAIYAFGGLFAHEIYDDEPWVVPRAKFAYPLSAQQFESARVVLFPTDAASVNALIGFSRGGSA